jgi:Cys-rich repeat protein
MTNGSWKLCSEVQFIHDGSAVNIGSEPNPLDPGSDTVDKPDNPVAEKCGDKDPCELKSSTALNDTTRKSEDTKFVEDYTSCLLKPENYCGPLKSKSGCHEEIKKAGDSTESSEAVKTFGYSAFGCSSSADDIKVCHSSQPKCVECNQSSHCGWKTVNKKCKTSNNTCVQCTQDSHCPSINNSLKGCTSNNVCVACTKSSHCGSSKVCKTSNSSYTCVQCTNDSDCGSGKKCKTATNTCYSVNTNQPVNWNQTSKVSCGGNKSAKSCCQSGGKTAISVQDIEKDTSGFKTRCKKNTQPFESWAIFKVDGGKVDGKGYGCNLTKGSSGGAGNALCH